jgi:hypothetical protein
MGHAFRKMRAGLEPGESSSPASAARRRSVAGAIESRAQRRRVAAGNRPEITVVVRRALRIRDEAAPFRRIHVVVDRAHPTEAREQTRSDAVRRRCVGRDIARIYGDGSCFRQSLDSSRRCRDRSSSRSGGEMLRSRLAFIAVHAAKSAPRSWLPRKINFPPACSACSVTRSGGKGQPVCLERA